MFISVIITAYNRKNYILNAINSALNQTLNKDKFEVIVVTNFRDKNITELQSDLKIKHLYLQDGTVGRFILEGLKISTGDIITFLDDDDLYDCNRLDTVYKLFNNFPEVNYYKSNLALIDSFGNLLPVTGKKKCYGGLYSKSKLVGNGNVQKLQLNLSSTTVRKYVFSPFIQILPEMTVGQDVWLYYMALAYGGLMYLDCTPLTYYRIHNFQTTNINNEINHFLEGYKSIYKLEKKINDSDTLKDLEKTRFRMLVLSLSRGHHASLRQLLNGFVFYVKHFKFNVRDFEVLVYSLFAITCTITFKKKANGIIAKVIVWISGVGFI